MYSRNNKVQSQYGSQPTNEEKESSGIPELNYVDDVMIAQQQQQENADFRENHGQNQAFKEPTMNGGNFFHQKKESDFQEFGDSIDAIQERDRSFSKQPLISSDGLLPSEYVKQKTPQKSLESKPDMVAQDLMHIKQLKQKSKLLNRNNNNFFGAPLPRDQTQANTANPTAVNSAPTWTAVTVSQVTSPKSLPQTQLVGNQATQNTDISPKNETIKKDTITSSLKNPPARKSVTEKNIVNIQQDSLMDIHGQPPPKEETVSSFGESYNPSQASSGMKQQKIAPPGSEQKGLIKRTMTQLQINQRVSSQLSSNSHKSKLDKQNRRISYAMKQQQRQSVIAERVELPQLFVGTQMDPNKPPDSLPSELEEDDEEDDSDDVDFNFAATASIRIGGFNVDGPSPVLPLPTLNKDKNSYIDVEELRRKTRERRVSLGHSLNPSPRNQAMLQNAIDIRMKASIASTTRLKQNLARNRTHQFINIDNDKDIQQGAAFRFQQYKQQFRDMCQRSFIDTEYDIISVQITFDSKYAIAVVFRSDKLSIVRIYSLQEQDMSSHYESQHEICGYYVKAKNIVQNETGKLFACPYFDNGNFHVMIFNLKDTLQKIDVSKILGIDARSRPNIGFHDPLINACFIGDNCLFINCFHNRDLDHHHFIYDYENKKVINQPVKIKIEPSRLNFPYKSFYDPNRKKVYSFYRQGQSITVDVNFDHHKTQDTLNKYKFQQITSRDLGQMYFIYDEVLVARTQDKVVFFRQVEVEDNKGELNGEKRFEWQQYHSLDHNGFIFFVKGNNRMQITMDKLIFFYVIDRETYMPILENCMYNFMGCSHMMFGPRSIYSITYKSGQIGFSIYQRKYSHGYLAHLSATCYQDSISISLNYRQQGQYMITEGNNIKVYDEKTHKCIDTIVVPFPKQIECQDLVCTVQQYPMELEILNMQIGTNPRILAVMVGHNYIHNSTLSLFLYIFQRVKKSTEDEVWELKKTRELPEELHKTSKFFHFNKDNINEILLCDEQKIIRYNYDNETYEGFYIFENALNSQPIFVVFNENQTSAVISTFYDVLYLRFKDDLELDIDNEYHVTDIRSIIYSKDMKKFYLMANKRNRYLGYYLMEIDEIDPEIIEPIFLINWRSKLDIGDAAMFFIKHIEKEINYLVLSYKSIYINAYNVLVIDLKTRLIQFRYEKYHLWEARITGVLLKNYDFVMISQDGRQVMSLGFTDKREVKDQDNQYWMIHSLDSCNDLILEETNHVFFKRRGSEIIISIQEQHTDQGGDTYFEDIYKVRIQDMSLRELLFCQSIFSCRQQEDIYKLIKLQPNYQIFYRSLLELEKSNLTQILAFDSRSIKALLDSENEQHFQSKFPIFYMTKYGNQTENQLSSAIDTALENNQIRALNIIILYVVKYQNSYVYSYLFTENLLYLIQKGVDVSALLKSDIFYHRFDYQEWPAIHTDQSIKIVPFNGSIFRIRDSYDQIFAGKVDEVDTQGYQDIFGGIEPQKIFKIKYTLNILPSLKTVGEESLMETVGNIDVYTDQEKIFSCFALQDLINFKWKNYGKKVHYLGFLFHAAYLVLYSVFINNVFVYRDIRMTKYLLAGMAVTLIYPLIYDMTQLKKQGPSTYSKDIWNYFDQANIWLGYYNVYHKYKVILEFEKLCNGNPICQVVEFDGDLTDSLDPEHHLDHHPAANHQSKVFLIFITLLMLIKTFFFLRIFKKLSYLVTMMRTVVYDLRIFMVFYSILLWMCSLIFSILEVGFYEKQSDPALRNVVNGISFPGQEYKSIPPFFWQLLWTVRMSLGDFDFGAASYLGPLESKLYWLVWFFVVFITCIVFLNFIIAEVSSSYEKVSQALGSLFLKERAQLIEEAQDMLFTSMRNDNQLFPKYLITREIEE